MEIFQLFHVLCLVLTASLLSSVHAQQPYVGKLTTNCSIQGNSSSLLGYSCNGENRTCQAYLTFRSQPPFNTVPSISTLLSANAAQLAQLNSVSANATFETNTIVLVPVTCSCSGQYYQFNTTFIVQNADNIFLIANNTFQGLSTCHAIQAEESNLTRNIYVGSRLTVPLRCACPTANQTSAGVKYLLSYLITFGDFVSSISAMFGVDTGLTLEANGLSEQNANIYPFTTLLVPLQSPPSVSQTIAPPPPPSSTSTPPPSLLSAPSSSSKSKTWVYALVGVLGGIVLTLAVVFIVFCIRSRRIRMERTKDPDTVVASESFSAIEKGDESKFEEEPNLLEILSSVAQSLKVYKFEELQSATENFSPSSWLGGSVYRGTINGDLAAIKKMNGDVTKEINLLNKINHYNLIRLSGACFNDGQWYLVFEYAANGPLSEWIYLSEGNHKTLNWMQRVQVALDVATGLNYLHNYASPPYVYKDLKGSNILLDSDFRAKITNFDLARSVEGEDGQFALTRHIVGTKGYMSPEYLENGLVSTKLDVYAFGVLMLEILTGKQVAELSEGVASKLSELLAPVLREEDGKESLTKFMDPSLQGDYPVELVVFLVKMVDGCVRKDPSDRPDMNEIVQCLSRAVNSSLSWEVSVSMAGYQSKP